MKPFDYLKVTTPKKALEALKKHRGKAKLLAGGTDLIPGLRRGKAKWDLLIDLKGIEAMKGIKIQKTAVTIGPLTTLGELARHRSLGRKLPILRDTALKMASPQVRNRGTVGGNLCNAAPSADLAPPLMVLGAKVKVLTARGARLLPLEEFFTGPGTTVLSKTKGLLTSITVPLPKKGMKAAYEALTPREAMDLSIVSAAACVLKDKKGIRQARLVLGACAPVPLRCEKAEELLVGTEGAMTDLERAAQAAAKASRPIDDVRASKAYRKAMALTVMRRALKEVLS